MSDMIKRKFKNIVVWYHGSGYDGCIWEPNIFIFDKKGKWQNIHSTGTSGCKTEKESRQMLQQAQDSNYNSDPHFYKINDREEWKDFLELCTNELGLNVTRKLMELYDYSNLFVICSECKSEMDPDEAILEGWRGCGGIMSTAEDLLCQDCYLNASCSYCGEYMGSEYEWEEDNKCEYCYLSHPPFENCSHVVLKTHSHHLVAIRTVINKVCWIIELLKGDYSTSNLISHELKEADILTMEEMAEAVKDHKEEKYKIILFATGELYSEYLYSDQLQIPFKEKV